METKICSKCNKVKENSQKDFHLKGRKSKILHDTCKECRPFMKGKYLNKESHWEEGKLICTKCNIFLEETEFNKRAVAVHRNGRDLVCRKCYSEDIDLVKAARLKAKNVYAKRKDFEYMIRSRLSGAKSRSKDLKYKEFELDVNFINDLWHKQFGICAVSGLPLTAVHGKGKVLTNFSIDRIDSKKGYTKENTQLVCVVVNKMKLDLDMEDFVLICSLINKYNSK